MAPAKGFADLVEKVMPAVISVEVETRGPLPAKLREKFRRFPGLDKLPPEFREFFERFGPQFRPMPRHPFRNGRAVGSGFFISPDGYIVTNHHVIRHAEKVRIKTHDGKTYDAEVIGSDPKTDLALLRVKGAKGRSFPHVAFADKEPRVGEWVVAVGNPFGFGGSVTTGIVSAKGRQIGIGPYDDLLQIDAPINKGNSGGPAFNLDGKVIGVNTAIFSPTGGSVGIGFAIPASVAKEIVAQLKEKGRVTRGWLGVSIQPVDKDMAESLGLEKPRGAIVNKVGKGSPAEKGGLRTGDTILAVNGDAVKDPRDLARKIARVAPGSEVALDILRDGQRQTRRLNVGRMPADDRIARSFAPPHGEGKAAVSLSGLGLDLAPAEDGEGVRVATVRPGSLAEDKRLRPGDVILEVAGIEVETPEAVRAALDKAAREGRKSVLFLIRSGQSQRFVALPIDAGKHKG
ncbi:MAG TPA: Do family serine endopeptidase [Thermopetrobacter sp.]|nr:Do family serine endopeptidase [Thermopetrobacter sp.]